MNDSDGRPIRYYLAKVGDRPAIWEASDVQVLKMLNENPGSELIGMPHSTRTEARAAARQFLNQTDTTARKRE